MPPLGPILLALFGLWLARWHPRAGRSLCVLALLGLVALSLPPVADALIHSLERERPISAQMLARAQAIVILSGDSYSAAPEYGGDTVGRFTLERIRYGVLLQRRSGLRSSSPAAAPFGRRPVAESMKEVIERDLHGHVTWVEGASRDTAENAAYSASLLKAAGISRIALVSHAWHLPRAIELFERHGLDVLAAPTGFTTASPSWFARVLPSVGALVASSDALHEWLGILVQRLVKWRSASAYFSLPRSRNASTSALRSQRFAGSASAFACQYR